MPNWYISTNGNDTNTGATPATPIKTLTRLSQLIQKGDTAYIAPGTYTSANIGSFTATNTGGGSMLDADMFRIIGDVSGSAFGVSAGDVVIDGQNVAQTQALFTFPGSTFSGRYHIANLKIINRQTSTGGTGVFNRPTGGSIRLTVEDCVFDNITATQTGQGGHIISFVSPSYVDEVLFSRCTFTMGQMASNTTAFNFTSASTAYDAQTSPHMDSAYRFEDCVFDVKSGLTGMSSFAWISYGASATAYNSLVGNSSAHSRMRFARCSLRATGYVVASAPALYSMCFDKSVVEFHDCDVKVAGINASGSGVSRISTRFYRSQIETVSVTPTAQFLIDSSQFFCGSGGVTSSVTSVSLEVANSLFSIDRGPVNLAASASGHFFKNSVVCGVFTFSAGNANIFSDCIISNYGRDVGGGASSYCIHYSAGLFMNNIFAKVGSSYTFASTTSYYMALNNILHPSSPGAFNTSPSDVGALSPYSSPPTTPPSIRMPSVIVPEYLNPISGRQSAKVPVAGFGSARFNVLLEAGRENVISLVARRSFIGGNVGFYIGEDYLGAAVDVTTDQTITLRYTPKRSGMYELFLYAQDGTAMTYATGGYTPNHILIDSVTVS